MITKENQIARWGYLLSILLILPMACSPSKDIAALPTLAALPSVMTSTPFASSTVVLMSTEESTADATAEITPEATQEIRKTNSPVALPTFTLIPITPTSVNWLDKETAIITKVMPLLKNDTASNYVAISGDETYLKFSYRYVGNSIRNQDYLVKIPYLLCELRDAGLTNLTVDAIINIYSAKGKSMGGDYLCISPASINQMNCTDPSRTNLSRIRNSGKCDL